MPHCHLRIASTLALLLAFAGSTGALASLTHSLRVELDTTGHGISVTDTVKMAAGTQRVEFALHGGLKPELADAGATLTLLGTRQLSSGIPIERYRVSLPAGVSQFTLRYGGTIHHPVARIGREYARSFGVSPGLISADGVYLGGASHWYPVVPGELLTFDLVVTQPSGWRSISQGERVSRDDDGALSEERWRIGSPQDEIFLIAARFTEYSQPAGAVQAMVLLREPAPQLADKYLAATAQYLQMYRKLLGPYPYSKFALVENFWETGYGMPSFTLLGPRVIRLPFILHSSYPHEILHNWWGNGVYVDYASGNWSEGLTSYLADHLIKEQRGQGIAYRRAALQRYADYVKAKKDFPLQAFRARHSSVSEAVGYGKTLMVFHMLRRRLGDPLFVSGLRRLYRRHKFKVAGFDDLREAFESVSEQPLEAFFEQWVERTGAPSLRVLEPQVVATDEGYRLTATIEQRQAGPAYRLRLPVALHLEPTGDGGEATVQQSDVLVTAKRHSFELLSSARPLRLDVDPEFDVFRRLARTEIPPAISQILGAERVLFVIPSSAPRAVREGYRNLVERWRRSGSDGHEVVSDAEVEGLPDDRSVWVFGWDNRFRSKVEASLSAYAYSAADDTVSIGATVLARATDAVVAVARNRTRAEHALAWVAVDDVAAMPGLARKLAHYGKYSYLGFRGTEPRNVAKGQWPVLASPMSVSLVSNPPPRGSLEEREALINRPTAYSVERMVRDISALASPVLAGRGLGSVGLDRAAQMIANRFEALGLEPAGDATDSYFQTWTEDLGGTLGRQVLRNVVAVLPGANDEWAGESVVVGAHYDHLGTGWVGVAKEDEGKLHPGADDNASGVAVMLELARILRERTSAGRSVVFVAFTGGQAGTRGALHYVRNTRAYPLRQVTAMINLDGVGRLDGRELLVLNASSAREWPHIFRGAGFVTGVPVKTVTQAMDSSDHSRFIEAGVPAVQIFSGAHADHHRPTDTPDKIDAAGLVKVASVLDEVVTYLVAQPAPLTRAAALAAVALSHPKRAPAAAKWQP